MAALPPVERKLLREVAYEAIRDAIVRGQIPPGTAVGNAAVAAQLGLSRPPVRDALARLADEGLVETKPQSYTRVTQLVPKQVRDAAGVVRAMHELATREAVPLLTAGHLEAIRQANGRFGSATSAGPSTRRWTAMTSCTVCSWMSAGTRPWPPPSSGIRR